MFLIFGLLWAFLAVVNYTLKRLKKEITKARDLIEGAYEMEKEASKRYNEAIALNTECAELNKKLQLRWQQMEYWLNCPN